MQVFRSRSVNLCRLATSRCFSLSTGPATGPLSGAKLSSVFQGVVSELTVEPCPAVTAQSTELMGCGGIRILDLSRILAGPQLHPVQSRAGAMQA